MDRNCSPAGPSLYRMSLIRAQRSIGTGSHWIQTDTYIHKIIRVLTKYTYSIVRSHKYLTMKQGLSLTLKYDDKLRDK